MKKITRNQPPRHVLAIPRDMPHRRPEMEIRKEAREQLNRIYLGALRRMNLWSPSVE